MPTYSETNKIGDFLKREFDQLHNRESVVIATGAAQNLAAGTVLGRITASGKYVLHDNAAADGSQNAAAILLFDANAVAADAPAVALVRGPAVVSDGALIFKAGITAPNRAAAVAALAALGIVARRTS
jgi:hypothetical protein